jgi:hypothetical protein
MATYTLVTTRASGGASTYRIDYADDDSIISDAKRLLGDAVISISIARGAVASELCWLGEWDLTQGEPRWTSGGLAPLWPAARGRGPRLVYRRPG